MIPLNLNRLGSQRGELNLEHKGSELKASGENMESGEKNYCVWEAERQREKFNERRLIIELYLKAS